VSEKDLTNEIAAIITRAGFNYEQEPAIGGLRPDFVVTGPNGQRVVIEAKAWQPGQENVRRAREQAKRYLNATGSNAALVVLSGLDKTFSSGNVVSLEALAQQLSNIFATDQSPRTESKEQKKGSVIFAAMPFDAKYDDTFLVAMAEAAKNNNASCVRVDHLENRRCRR